MRVNRTLLAGAVLVPYVLLLLPALAIAALMALFVACAKAVGSLLEPRFVAWTELIAFDPTLGWKPRPDLDTYYLAERDDVFRIVTDREGWPGRRSLDESNVVVIGDSFAFGYGVDTDKSFAEVDPALWVKAVGAPGYSMVQGVLLMEQFGRRLEGKLVVWLVFLENDLQDNLLPEMRQYRAPFARRDPTSGWEIVRGHIAGSPWSCSDLDKRRLFPQFCVPGPLADRAYSAADYLIGRAATACAASGARLVLITIPDLAQLTAAGVARLAMLSGRAEQCDVDYPDRCLARSCDQHGVGMTRGKDHLTAADYNRREGIHWSEDGHRRVAAMLRRIAAATTASHGHDQTSRGRGLAGLPTKVPSATAGTAGLLH